MIKLKGMTWDHPRGFDPLAASIEVYEKQSGVQIHWEKRSLKDFGDSSIESLSEIYDLIILDHPHVGVACRSECVIPLGDYLPSGLLEMMEADSLGPTFSSYFYQGKQWALPIDGACQVACYRPDVLSLDELPVDWNGCFSVAETLKKEGLTIGMALCPTDCLCSFLTLVAQLGNPPKEGNANLIKKEIGIQALDTIRKLRDVCHPESLNWNPIKLYDQMAASDNLVYSPLAFGYTNYSRKGFRKHLLGYAGIPGKRKALLGGAGIAVSASCKNPQVAADYAAWLTQGDFQSATYVDKGGQPAHSVAWDSLANNQLTYNFFQNTRYTMENAYVRPRYAGWPSFQEHLGERIHTFLLNDEDPMVVLRDLEDLYRNSY